LAFGREIFEGGTYYDRGLGLMGKLIWWIIFGKLSGDNIHIKKP